MAVMNGPREGGGQTTLGQVLAAFAARGGQLTGARRRLDSPLTLTHIRWTGMDGAVIDAVRMPEAEGALSPEEREAWVQLALDCPVPQGPMTPETAAAWVPLVTAPARASELVRLMHASRSGMWNASQPYSPVSGMPYGMGVPQPSGPGSSPTSGGYIGSYSSATSFGSLGAMGSAAPVSQGFAASSASGGLSPNVSGSTHPYPSTMPPATGAPAGESLLPFDNDTVLINTPADWTNSWQTPPWQGGAEMPEVTVLVCVEIELPRVLAGAGGADYTRGFSRDVAASFKRVCQAIPQVRETRGWMRGAYLILAARIAVGSGNRAPSSLEMESAAQTLAEALARETIPYNRLTLANPGEWAQGAALPS